MSFFDLAKKRHSTRKYQDKPLEHEKLMKILEAGRIAPTAANVQPQRVLVIREKAGLEKLGKAANVYGAPVALVVCADNELAWTRPFDKKKATEVDASIITDHMMLEAAELGISSVWIGYFKPDVLRSELNIPDNYEPVSILALGYGEGEPSSPERHTTERLPLEKTVFFDSF
ncbi:MAG: nitroreductase family protein [Parabacteroides sp.]|nr:nitroreductase family protein [Parabacteroides sp.]